MSPVSIGRLAKSVGLSVPTLRYYEQLGLLQSEKRSQGAPRQFASTAFDRLKAIQRLQDMGFTLREIGELLRAPGGDLVRGRRYLASLIRKLKQVDEDFNAMRRRRQALIKAIKECQNNPQSRLPRLLGLLPSLVG